MRRDDHFRLASLDVYNVHTPVENADATCVGAVRKGGDNVIKASIVGSASGSKLVVGKDWGVRAPHACPKELDGALDRDDVRAAQVVEVDE